MELQGLTVILTNTEARIQKLDDGSEGRPEHRRSKRDENLWEVLCIYLMLINESARN